MNGTQQRETFYDQSQLEIEWNALYSEWSGTRTVRTDYDTWTSCQDYPILIMDIIIIIIKAIIIIVIIIINVSSSSLKL